MDSREILMDTRRAGKFLLVLAGMCELIGCAVGPKYKTPTAPTSPVYKEMGNWKTAQPNDQHLGGNWWEIFNDPQLNALEEQINVSNQNLKAAVAQYQEARRSSICSCRLLSDHHGLAISYP